MLAIVALLAFFAAPAHAAQTRIFQETFGSAVQPTFSTPEDIAVDQSTGDVLVIDAAAGRIARYHADGTPSDFSALDSTNFIDGAPGEADATPQGDLAFTTQFGSSFFQIAVDNSGTATDGDIYVTQNKAEGTGTVQAIDVFAESGEYLGQLTGGGGHVFGEGKSLGVSPCGVTVDASGDVYVGGWTDGKIYKYAPSANPPANADLTATFAVSGGLDWPCQLAAGVGPSTASLFAKDYQGEGEVYKLDASTGTVDYRIYSGEDGLGRATDNPQHIAVDPTNGHLLVATGEGIYEFDASGVSKAVPVVLSPGASSYVAAAPSGRLYLSEGSHLGVWSPLVPLPDASTGKADPIGETKATLGGSVEAHGAELTQCAFEYGTTTSYGTTVPCAESPAQIGTATGKVHADISGLSPETTYHFRLILANEFGSAEPQGKDQSFQTVSKPAITATWSEHVSLSDATIKAEINPLSAATEYRFEWGLSETPYEHLSAPTSIGAEPTTHTVTLPLSSLTPGATYHYRVTATNHCHPESSPATLCTSEGPERTFTTFLPFSPETDCANQALRFGPAAALPDCRAYEMVSPVDKGGGDVVTELDAQNQSGGYVQSRPDGDALTYTATAAFPGVSSSFRFNQYMAERHERGTGEEGWANRGLNPAVSGQLVDKAIDTFGFNRYFRAFTPDLCSAWWVDYQSPPLTPQGQDGYANLYRRDNCGAADGTWEALTNVSPIGPANSEYVQPQSIEGISADGSHTVFLARAQLTPEANPSQNRQLYDFSGGALHLLSVLPDGSPFSGIVVGVGSGYLRNLATAVSKDGERVYWSDSESLYLRLHPEQGIVAKECSSPKKACTILVSKPVDQFWAATPDGSTALYTKNETLYEFSLARYEAEPAQASQQIATGVQGLAGQSTDLSRVYFVSTEALPNAGENSEGDEAQAGQPNLYLGEGGSEPAFEFIATLDPHDVGQVEVGGLGNAYTLTGTPLQRATRVSPDGARLVFDSRAPITGYDNASLSDGRRAVEVFTYEAGGPVTCVSCNPGGGRPATREMQNPYEAPWQNTGSPANVPAAAYITTWEHPFQASNALSADGNRIFFNSNDALLPRDANGAQDVYEWEAPGTGICAPSASNPSYFPQNGGCLYLISGGESSYESQFWEASPDGSDVFFTTAQSLIGRDPGSIDLYDARVGGGFPEATPHAACEGEACQSPPAPPALPSLATAAHRGPGNLAEEPAAKPSCLKGKIRKHGRCAKKHRHRKQKPKQPKRRSAR